MIEIRLIGDTEVRRGSAVLSGRDFGGVKPRRLLEVLALHLGVTVSKHRLADLLWEDQPPVSWTTTLEGYVSLLRGRLEPGLPARASVIRTVNGGYTLDSDRVRVDVATVRNLVAQARPLRAGVALPLLRQALDLAAGELLSNSAGVPWAEEARREHVLLRVEAAGKAAQHALHLGQVEMAVTFADAVLALDPLAEEACRLAMRALWAAGRTAEAVRRHADLRTVLAHELGVDPTPQTQAVLLQLLRDEAPPAIPVQRRSTDGLLAAGGSERKVDVLAGAVVLALRSTSEAAASTDDDPELVAKLEEVLRHLQGVDRAAALVS